MVTLTLERTRFFSPGDEAAMFEWLGHIPSVKRVQGIGPSLHIYVPSKPSRASLRELLALFCRYGGALSQFNRFPCFAHTPLPSAVRSRRRAFTWWFTHLFPVPSADSSATTRRRRVGQRRRAEA